MKTPAEISARRLAAIDSTPEGDDLHWSMTCEAWRRRQYDAEAVAELMAIAGKMLLAGERLPGSLATWLGEALTGAAREKTPVDRRAMLARRLNITAPQRRQKYIDREELRRMIRAGTSKREMALMLDVDRRTLAAWLSEITLTPKDRADLLRGLVLARNFFKR